MGVELPEGVAADEAGQMVTDPHAVEMLLPLGGQGYGYKGAGLAGVATLFSALLTGTTLDADLIPMFGGGDTSSHRNLGHFVMIVDPDKFVGRELFGMMITRYLESLRGVPPQTGGVVMAPGDREWAEAERREAEGAPVDPDTIRFLGL
jgi:LDH2 family malate/lactate/ureidoglycolate dehydrogenase